MAPSTLQLTQQVRQFIWYHLDNDMVNNALFLAGQLYAMDTRNPGSVHLLSLCHFRAGQHKSAYDQCRNWSQKREHLGCAYVFAKACLELGRYVEGISALEKTRSLWENRSPTSELIPRHHDALDDPRYLISSEAKSDAQRRPTPDAAAFYCILGQLAHKNGDIKKAVESYAAALKLNPFMWDAYERLCDTGASIVPSNIFKESHLSASFLQAFDVTAVPRVQANTTNTQDVTSTNTVKPVQITISNSADASKQPKIVQEAGITLAGPNVTSQANAPNDNNSMSGPILMETPPAPSKDDISLDLNGNRTSHVTNMEPPNAPLRKSRMQASSVDVQGGGDVAKIWATTKRSQSKEGSGDSTDTQEPSKTSLFPPRTSKRTISGNDPNVKIQPPLDPTAPGQRRSVRLFKKAPSGTIIPGPRDGEPDFKKVKATGTKGRTAAASTVGRIVSGNRKPPEHHHCDNQKPNTLTQPQPPSSQQHQQQQPQQPTSQSANNNIAKPNPVAEAPIPQRPRPQWTSDAPSAVPYLIHLLSPLAQAYHALAHHDPQQTITHLSQVSTQQRDTPYVLSLLGRAQHDLSLYTDAVTTFSRLRQLAPSEPSYMDVYSTALWHLKSTSELAYLAHELMDLTRSAPEPWCALGNAFSLQREHANAIKCFQRATALAPTSAYAWTLLGHELFAAEDLDKALAAYRRALAVDRRHYQAWYGLGRVYERSARLDLAEKHYRVAARINPRHAVLRCCIGAVQDRRGHHAAALDTYDEAVRLAPASAMARFKRARGLLRLRRFEESREEFEALRALAPEEANVYFMLGRVYGALGRRGEAMKCFSGALGLDPKAAPLIKDAMESLSKGVYEEYEGEGMEE